MRRALLSTAILAIAVSAHADMVQIGGGASGYLSLPKGSPAKRPAVIVVQEWWGLNDWVKQQTDRFAGQGYVALAPDLYRGKVAKDPQMAHELMRGMPEDRAISDLRTAFQYLAKRNDVDPKRIGVIGWCMGGGYALALATYEPRLAATVINYGRLITQAGTIAAIRSPILGHFGATDNGIPPDSVKAFSETLGKVGKTSNIRIYAGAGHAFMNRENQQGYNERATVDAWKRIDDFFANRLRVNMPNS